MSLLCIDQFNERTFAYRISEKEVIQLFNVLQREHDILKVNWVMYEITYGSFLCKY